MSILYTEREEITSEKAVSARHTADTGIERGERV